MTPRSVHLGRWKKRFRQDQGDNWNISRIISRYKIDTWKFKMVYDIFSIHQDTSIHSRIPHFIEQQRWPFWHPTQLLINGCVKTWMPTNKILTLTQIWSNIHAVWNISDCNNHEIWEKNIMFFLHTHISIKWGGLSPPKVTIKQKKQKYTKWQGPTPQNLWKKTFYKGGWPLSFYGGKSKGHPIPVYHLSLSLSQDGCIWVLIPSHPNPQANRVVDFFEWLLYVDIYGFIKF